MGPFGGCALNLAQSKGGNAEFWPHCNYSPKLNVIILPTCSARTQKEKKSWLHMTHLTITPDKPNQPPFMLQDISAWQPLLTPPTAPAPAARAWPTGGTTTPRGTRTTSWGSGTTAREFQLKGVALNKKLHIKIVQNRNYCAQKESKRTSVSFNVFNQLYFLQLHFTPCPLLL